MKNKRRSCLGPVSAIAFTLLLAGCATESPDEIVEGYAREGWTKVAVHGKPGPIERHGRLSSETARSVEASWVDRGRRKTKLYSQEREYYLVLRFFREDGDQFAVVMRKKK